MSNNMFYQLALDQSSSSDFEPVHTSVITTFHGIATVAIQRIIHLMNNTEMCKIRPLENIDQVLVFLEGKHDDEGLSGDRGDFYRRLLANQMFVTDAIEGVTHTNVQSVVQAAIDLEKETSNDLAKSRHVDIDEKILAILARLAGIF